MSINNKVNVVLSLLINFVKIETGVDEKLITQHTCLRELGLQGLKGIMFIKKYAYEFKVNIDAFNFEQHFFEHLVESNPPKKALLITIAHLEKAIVAGKFDDDILKSN